MYYPHFGLKEPPFKITPNTDFFFSGGNRGAVLDALVYAITNGEGIIKVVGEVGSGKTMLCRMLQTILPEHIESVYLANPSMAPEEVLHAIAFELQLKLPKNPDRLKVMQQLQAHLLTRHAEGRQVVIFVEEAQSMPLATLEEIRLLSNLETKQDKLLQIVLFGQPELDFNLNETHIRQLRERITHSFHLGPLHTKDVADYLIFRLRAAGYHGPHLFTDAAVRKLSSAAQGLVRRVNILADKALLATFADNQYLVTPRHVQAAINDSEFGGKASHYRRYVSWGLLFLILFGAGLAFGWWYQQHSSTPAKNTQSWLSSAASAKQSAVAVTKTERSINFAQPANAAVISAAAQTKLPQSQSKPNSGPLQSTTQAALADQPGDLVSNRLTASQQWLTGNPSTVTLQIMSLTSDEQLKTQLALLDRQLDINQVHMYRVHRPNAAYTALLYGAYATQGEAMAALEQLPQTIQDNQPRIRTIGGINRDIQQAQ